MWSLRYRLKIWASYCDYTSIKNVYKYLRLTSYADSTASLLGKPTGQVTNNSAILL